MHVDGQVTTFSNTHLKMSRVGIGTWAIGGGGGPQPEEQSLDAIYKALELGCCLIDTAALYGNGRAEKLVAQALRTFGKHVTTLTKVYPQNYSWSPTIGTPIKDIYPPEHIIAQAEASLRRLETDCLDCLLLQTWCPSWGEEFEWYETMLTLQKQGKIRTFGISVSDHRPQEANEVIKAGRVNIIETAYNILDQRAATCLFPLAQEYNTTVIARTPLASGVLSGLWSVGKKFHRTDWRKRVFRDELLARTIERVERLKMAVSPSYPLAQLALRFCLSHPAVTAVIPGVRSVEQTACSLAVNEQEKLPQDTLDIIDKLWLEEFCYNVRTSISEDDQRHQ